MALSGGALHTPTGPQWPTWRSYDRFMLEHQAAGNQPSTMTHYRAQLVPYITWLGERGITRLEDADKDVVLAYHVHLHTRPPQSPNARDADHLQRYSIHAAQRTIR